MTDYKTLLRNHIEENCYKPHLLMIEAADYIESLEGDRAVLERRIADLEGQPKLGEARRLVIQLQGRVAELEAQAVDAGRYRAAIDALRIFANGLSAGSGIGRRICSIIDAELAKKG